MAVSMQFTLCAQVSVWRDCVDNDIPMPPCAAWERKETLYQKAITLYERGQYYEVLFFL